MKPVCCSDKCEKQVYCINHAINNEGVNVCEDFYSFGSGTMTENGCEIDHWCGELGNWEMFEPIEPTTITVVQELYLGSDEEIQKHIDESGYTGLITPEQVRNIVHEGLYKMFKDSIKT